MDKRPTSGTALANIAAFGEGGSLLQGRDPFWETAVTVIETMDFATAGASHSPLR